MSDETTTPFQPPDLDVITQLIKMNWEDVHHTRNQDWRLWIVIATVGAGIVQALAFADPDKESWILLLSVLLYLGFAFSAIGALISIGHWDLSVRKITHIRWLEEVIVAHSPPELRQGLPFGEHLKPIHVFWFLPTRVSHLLISTYITLAAAFGYLAYYVFERRPLEQVIPELGVILPVVFVGVLFILFWYRKWRVFRYRRRLAKKRPSTSR